MNASGWIVTQSGRKVDVFHPTPESMDIEDIAHALSMICRFGGHTKEFYSVAQHSVLVSYICNKKYALQGLMHDATEAFCGDVVRPIKRNIQFFCDMEDGLHNAISQKFHIYWNETIHKSIKRADNIALLTEAKYLVQQELHSKLKREKPLEHPIKGWTHIVAKNTFLARFKELTSARKSK